MRRAAALSATLATLATLAALATSLLLAACPAPAAQPGHPVVPPAATPSAAFAELAAAATERTFRFEPADGVSLGLHAYDGKLPDRSAAGIAAEIASLRADRDALTAFDLRALTLQQRDERDVLLANAHAQLFQLAELDQFHANPMAYAPAINLDAYVIRDYAPVATRVAAIIAVCDQLPAYLAQARSNVRLPIPATWIDTALAQTHGLAEFADRDIRTALPNQPGLDPALDRCKAALVEHAAWLGKQRATASDAYALGKDRFLAMLRETQGVTADLPRLQQIAEADLARNTVALGEAAHAIAPDKSVAEVVRMLAGERPTADNVLEIATHDASELRAFLVAKKLVSLPSDAVAEVRITPPFQRWNAAFLDRPGPFEGVQLPSFFYISPPDPTWPADEQATYLPPLADLVFVTVHEVYPGHFVHGLHINASPSHVLKSFCTYSTSEGWAHYAEEMMYDEGLGKFAPRARVGMLKEALLRDVRFIVTLGEHTGGMTVDHATQLFVEKGFVDPGNAKQQAVRGTFDPMFLAYTLGKLMIRKLHADWSVRHPGASLGDFHDAFLAHACAPIPVIRRDMLGDDSPALP